MGLKAHLRPYVSKLRSRWNMWKMSRVSFQKTYWQEVLEKYDWDNEEIYGNDWGNPENPKDRFGNYLEIKRRITDLVTPETTILEIGSLAGKWVKHILRAKKVICVDLHDMGFRYIGKKFPLSKNIEFYLTKGDELSGIKDATIDVVFSMDTFVRVPKKCIENYFAEIRRVLKPGGRFFIHLPCVIKAESINRNFVNLTLAEIQGYCRNNGFVDVTIDKDVIIHGVIVEGYNPRPIHARQ